eukprot:gnl/Hemi2/24585_TR8273_c0_g1_i1.p1 gnl/Hemi2/24585_TR8273_c0_g1~~gnl/Hemi2/24585_TR8273_c0_g1_i1.p1  ORF type:complete len:264 (+),score=70.63 gnl/Hemi2/24585_TR8273_c0_g1_i1:44-835(+)
MQRSRSEFEGSDASAGRAKRSKQEADEADEADDAVDSDDDGEDPEDSDEDSDEDPDEDDEDGEDPDEDPATSAVFKQINKELSQLEKSSGKWVFMTAQWKKTDEVPVPTIEMLRSLPKILLPVEGRAATDRIIQTLDDVCEGLFMLWTRHTYSIMGVYEQELKKLNACLKKPDHQASFVQAFALTLAMQDVPHWYNDTEDPQAGANLMSRVYKAWQKVFAQTDAALGLSGEGARANLINWLKKFGQDFKKVEGNRGLRMSWFK